ncbi:hypothetical protein CEXT_154091 [Caerostris extrusa]|uniref:Uncharacterized protein n=1 Tax=Caerostris extrusa TaxID=172846 RepID=A0AAV4RB03_CAEEX|nr:hypothetical protein CEXT_154091 [Caerostris extrusa]
MPPWLKKIQILRRIVFWVSADSGTRGGGPDVEGSKGDKSTSPFAVEEVIFDVKECRILVVDVGCPLVDNNGAMLVGLTRVGESSKPIPPSLYLKEKHKYYY